MKRKYKPTILCMLLLISLVFGGSGWYNLVILDDAQHIMYENLAVDTVIKDYNGNKSGFYDLYHDRYVVLWGEIASIASNNKSFSLTAMNGEETKAISCKTNDTGLSGTIKGLDVGENVQVYGKVFVNWFTKDASLTITKIEQVGEEKFSENSYTTINGTHYDLDNMYRMNMKNADVSYHIPISWTGVEKALENERLEGCQYCLNEINNATAKAESLFVFYFDYEKCLKSPSDSSRPQEVQVAIINNILKKDPGTSLEFARTNFKTYYGAHYNYYSDTYTNSENQQTYRVEFVFEEVGSKGVMVYLYVVNSDNEKRHIDDVMMVLRTVE